MDYPDSGEKRMKAQEYAGIALICGAIAFFFFLSEGLSTPSGYYFLDQEFEDCSSLPMDCIKEALVNCSPMRNGGGDPYLDLRFYVHPYNDSDCVVHQNLEMQWVDGTISLSADCLVRSGNYTDEEFTAVMEDAWSSSCNGSLVELYPAGQNPIEITIQKPREGDSYLKGDSVLMDIMVKGNKTHLLEDLTFMVDAGEGWVRADTTDIITIDLFSVDMQKTVFYQGTWNTSRIPVTEDADIRLRADALFRKDDDAIVTFSEAVTVRLNTSSLIPAGGDRFEPDNTFSDPGDAAKEIVPGEPYQNRSFHVPNDVDYIYFEGMGKRMFIVSWWTGTSTVKAGLTLYDSQRRLVAERVDVDGQLQAVHGLREDERIYIKVESLGAAGKYNIIVTQLTDGDGDGFTIGLGPESDCDDTDPGKRPIRSGMMISQNIFG